MHYESLMTKQGQRRNNLEIFLINGLVHVVALSLSHIWHMVRMTPAEFDEHIRQRDVEIAALLTTINNLVKGFGAEQKGDGSLADILLHLLLTQLDIFVGIKHMEMSKGGNKEYEEYYFSRIVALGCFDVLDNLNMFEGKLSKYRIAPETSELMKEVNRKKDELGVTKKQYFEKLSDIRHTLIAHRDRLIGVEQNKGMKEVDPAEIHHIANSIIAIRNQLILSLFDVRNKAGENPEQPRPTGAHMS